MRNVVLGRGSRVWRALANRPALSGVVAIGHADLGSFEFSPADRVWVLSYSGDPRENRDMLAHLGASRVQEIVYVSSSSTIVNRITRCYRYPRVKFDAETEALALPQAKVLTVGLMYEDSSELPGGASVATSFDEFARFMTAPEWPEAGGRRRALLRVVERPFGSALEGRLFRAYGVLLRLAGSRPCVLRPLDLLLRALGMRWYGYTCLSNRLWISTIS
ncbi:hypothetical protein BURC_02905 [Burkholderiaceae bacterium]|nr:hypothetical protein BURC_02905 [Burkholderiaceae bacterium]